MNNHIISFIATLAFLMVTASHAYAARTPSDTVRADGDTIAVYEMSVAELMGSPAGEVLVDRLGRIMDERIDERIDEFPRYGGMRDRVQKIIGILAVFGLPFIFATLLLFAGISYLNRRGERRARLIEMSLQCRQPLPPEFYQRRRSNRLQSGLTWIAWGAGLMIFFIVVGEDSLAALMAIPCFIGVSKLLTLLIESRNGGRIG